MAAGRHNLSRRALLGAAFGASAALGRGGAPAAAPTTLGGATLASASTARVPALGMCWNEALAAFRIAGTRLAGLDADASDDMFGDLECARLDALRRLLRAPAPDLRALSLKIDLAVDEDVATLAGAEPCLSALKADAWRLAYGG